jgi:hypothetical protein
MKRFCSTVFVIAVALVLLAAIPASADKGGTPRDGSCGLGKSNAHEAIADQTGPGASEAATFPPSEAGCTGNG